MPTFTVRTYSITPSNPNAEHIIEKFQADSLRQAGHRFLTDHGQHVGTTLYGPDGFAVFHIDADSNLAIPL